ncbi:MAG: hypothetical protein WCS03_07430 [Bacteroidota bacterium]
MNDRYYINIIIRRIEKKLNWKKVSLWTDNEYKKLRWLIYEDTTISISPQTLKRLFGKVKYKDDYTAQLATKDALARFLEYADWDAFVQKEAHSLHKATFFLKRKVLANLRDIIRLIIICGSTIIIAGLFLIVKAKNKTVIFNADNITGIAPHTVSFNYNLSNYKNKEVFIDFDQNEAEDKTKGELLDKRRTLLNHCFESPGFFNVRISTNGRILASTKIHVLSEGWNSYYFNDDNYVLRKFVFGLDKKVLNIIGDGTLYISPKELNNQGFNGNAVYYIEHLFYKDFKVSADSCTFEVRYKNSSEIGGISCYDAEFRIVGENGLASVMLVQKGCYRWSEITVAEKHLSGKYNDLSFLNADLSSWNVLKIVIENNKAIITNGADTIYTSNYNQPLGQVKGIRFITKGSGAFDYVRLFNYSGELKFDDNFDNL